MRQRFTSTKVRERPKKAYVHNPKQTGSHVQHGGGCDMTWVCMDTSRTDIQMILPDNGSIGMNAKSPEKHLKYIVYQFTEKCSQTVIQAHFFNKGLY